MAMWHRQIQAQVTPFDENSAGGFYSTDTRAASEVAVSAQ
jgi:hypothetical protein